MNPSPVDATRENSLQRDRGDRLESKRVCFLRGEQSHRRRSVLLVSARPRRPAVRRPVPTCPGNVRVLDSTGKHLQSGCELLPPVYEHFLRADDEQIHYVILSRVTRKRSNLRTAIRAGSIAKT